MAKIKCDKYTIEVLYEDNHIIVVMKPPNMPVQKDSSGDLDMQTALKAYIKEKYNKPGNVYLGIVHRLDRPVGGVMVFARTSKAASRLSDSIAKRETEKKYYAVTQSKLYEQKGELSNYIAKDKKTGNAKIVGKNAEGAKEAALEYRLKEAKNGFYLYDISLITGRHHQIRAQLANAGAPIWGDQRYAFKLYKPGQQIALFAYSISFVHPVKKELVNFKAEQLPGSFPWTVFDEEK